MPQLLTETKLESRSMPMIRDLIQDFITFLAKEPEHWLIKEYENCLCIPPLFH
jgi:hypothetical protein